MQQTSVYGTCMLLCSLAGSQKAAGQGEGQAWGSDSDLQKAKEPDGLRWLWSSQWGKNHIAILLKKKASYHGPALIEKYLLVYKGNI